MKLTGLRRRLVLAAVGAVALALALVTVAFHLVLDRRLSADADKVLRSRAEAQIATLDVVDGRLRVQQTANDTTLDERVWVFDASGAAVEQPAAPANVQSAVAELARSHGSPQRDVEPDTRLLALPVRAPGKARAGTVVAAVSHVPYGHTASLALIAAIILDALAVLAVALVARRTVTVALRPVAQMTAQAAVWSEHELDRRFGLGPPKDELTALAATLDALLGRLSGSLRHEQRLMAELSHELRTPLAGARAEAELALRRERSPEELRESLSTTLAQIERMQGVVEALMADAENAAGGTPARSDAVDAGHEALERARPAARDRGIETRLEHGTAPLTVAAERELVVQVLAPLLDNAIGYGRSQVTLEVRSAGEHVAFTVRDNGPGVSPEEASTLFDPGVRGSAAGARRGAGLGLPLARRLARSAGGSVRVVDSSEGGYFVAELPAA